MAEKKIKPWRIIESQTLVEDTPWLTLTKDTVETASGATMDNFYVEHRPDFAIVIVWDDNKRLLTVKQYRHGVQAVSTEVPAGMIEMGEDPDEAIKRELLEETGYEADNWTHLFNLTVNISCADTYAHCYMASSIRKVSEQKLDDTEDIIYEWMPYDEVIEMLHTGGFEQGFIAAAIYRSLELMKKITIKHGTIFKGNHWF